MSILRYRKISGAGAHVDVAGTDRIPAAKPAKGYHSVDALRDYIAGGLPSSGLELLTADRTYHVATTGSDVTGTGASGAPWATLQHAVDYIAENLDFAGYRITIDIADDTGTPYVGVQVGVLYNSASLPGELYFLGNPSTPGNVEIGNCVTYLATAAGSFYAIAETVGTVYLWVNGVRTVPTAGPSYLADPVQTGRTAWYLGNPDAVDGSIEVGNVSTSTSIFAGNVRDTAGNGGLIACTIAGAAFTGNPSSCVGVLAHAEMAFINGYFEITGSPTFTSAFLRATEGANSYVFMFADSFFGTATGKKFLIDETTGGGTFIQIANSGSITGLPGSLAGQLLAGTVTDNRGTVEAGKARVSSQFDKTNDTLADVTGLSVDIKTGRRYAFRAVLYTTSDVAAGVKAAISGTATGSAVRYEALVYAGAAIAAQTRAAALAAAVGGVTAVTAAMVVIEGTIACNGTGTLTVQFAQNATNAAASSVLTGSTLIVTPVP